MGLNFSIIVPAYNERDNIPLVVERLEKLLPGDNGEIVFVDDDSKDGSREVLMSLARSNPRVRFIRRIGRRGLSSACLEGIEQLAVFLDREIHDYISVNISTMAALVSPT